MADAIEREILGEEEDKKDQITIDQLPERVNVTTKDGTSYELVQAEIFQCGMLRDLLEVAESEEAIPLEEVEAREMTKIKEWLTFFAERDEDDMDSGEVEDFKEDFFDVETNRDEIIRVTNAAHYLSVGQMVDLAVEVIAKSIEGRSTEEIRKFWNIQSDFTPEEEEEVRKSFFTIEPNT